MEQDNLAEDLDQACVAAGLADDMGLAMEERRHGDEHKSTRGPSHPCARPRMTPRGAECRLRRTRASGQQD